MDLISWVLGADVAAAVDSADAAPDTEVSPVSPVRASDRPVSVEVVSSERPAIQAEPRRAAGSVLITGNTFPVKDQIKALAPYRCRFDSAAQGWWVPAEVADQARALVAGAGAKRPAPRGDGQCTKCGRACKPQYATCFLCSGKRRRAPAPRYYHAGEPISE